MDRERNDGEPKRGTIRAVANRILPKVDFDAGERAYLARDTTAFTTFTTDLGVALDLDEGRFHVTAADALPAAATTPEQALGQLRKVLARRSYVGLLQVLSPKTRAAMEADLQSLVEGLDEPGALDVQVVGDSAVIQVPGGHRVELRRQDGIWYVDDFE